MDDAAAAAALIGLAFAAQTVATDAEARDGARRALGCGIEPGNVIEVQGKGLFGRSGHHRAGQGDAFQRIQVCVALLRGTRLGNFALPQAEAQQAVGSEVKIMR